jgi:hypothetical protein
MIYCSWMYSEYIVNTFSCLKLSLHDSRCFNPAMYLRSLFSKVNIRLVTMHSAPIQQSRMPEKDRSNHNTRWFKYDRDRFVCKQAAISPGHIWTTLYILLTFISNTTDSPLIINRLWLILLQAFSICTSQLRLLSIVTPRKLVFLCWLLLYSLLEFLIHFPACTVSSGRECSVFWSDL